MIGGAGKLSETVLCFFYDHEYAWNYLRIIQCCSRKAPGKFGKRNLSETALHTVSQYLLQHLISGQFSDHAHNVAGQHHN